MRSPLVLLLAVATLGACGTKPIDVGAETAALRVRSQALAAAEATMKTDTSLAFWAEDAIIQPAGAPEVKGRDAIRKLYDSYFGGGQLKELKGTASQIVMSQGGDLAYESGINRLVFKGPSGDLLDMGKYLLVWRKINGQWFVAALSFTSDAAAPVVLPGK